MLLCLSLLTGSLFGQTVLHPGDIAVLSMSSDMVLCGLPATSDEIQFFCYADIENGTVIDLTDNGWEYANAGYFGDNEGTLRMTRTGGTIPRGTIITLQAQPIGGGNWNYRTVSPDNQWTITDMNVPSGHFNLDAGGDQIIFMQGGDWDNQGGNGIHRARYTGRIIHAANMRDFWAANATVNTSNLPDGVDPCAVQSISQGSTNFDFVKYAGPIDETSHLAWLDRISNPGLFISMGPPSGNCMDLQNWPPPYPAVIPIEDIDVSISCIFCDGCAPHTDYLLFQLPQDGPYNVAYTNGIDTFLLENILDDYAEMVVLDTTTDFWLVYIEPAGGGCRIYSNLEGEPHINVLPLLDPGEYNEVWICEVFTPGYLDLNYFLNGTPDTGGIWLYSGGELVDGIWSAPIGEGLFTYYVSHGQGANCMPPFDSASVRVRFIDISETIIDVGCDQNGTPNDIFDDRIVLTLTVPGDHFGPVYSVQVFGTQVTPMLGVADEPSVFYLSPGTAISAVPFIMRIQDWSPFGCKFDFVIDPPGYCSDPCDADMIAFLEGPPEDLCVYNCPEEEYTLTIDVDQGTAPYYFDFTLSVPGYPDWHFNQIPLVDYDFHSMRICIDSVPAPTLTLGGTLLTLPASLAEESLLFTLDQVYDKYECPGILPLDQLYFTIHERPDISTDTLRLCRYEAIDVDLTEYDQIVSPWLDVEWYDGDPFNGGDKINSPTGANLENVVELWGFVMDDYCGSSIRVPFIILPTPDLQPIPPINLCAGQSIQLSALPIVDLGMSMATYSYYSGMPADSSNLLDPMSFTPADSMIVWVIAEATPCLDTLAVQINVEDYPDLAITGLPCDMPGDTWSLLFETSTDSVFASAGLLRLKQAGTDSLVLIPNDTPVTLVLANTTGLCRDTFLVAAPDCNCPMINSPIPNVAAVAICQGETIPTFTVTADPGLLVDWYNQPAGGVALATNTLSFTPSGAGTYYAEARDPANDCRSLRAPINLTIHTPATLQALPNPVLCEGESIDLTTLAPAVTNGIAGAGQWFDLLTQQPVNGPVIPASGQVFYYVFTSTAGACESRDTIQVNLDPLPAIDLFAVDCDDLTLTFSLGFTSDATLVVASAGTLVQVPGTDTFLLQDIPYDTDIQFLLTNELTNCTSTASLPAPDCSCPPLLQSDALSLCSGSMTFNVGNIQNPGINGTWTIVSTPPGGQPATLAGTVLSVANADPGAYRLLFVRNILLDDCIDSAFVDIDLLRSPTADAGADGTSCAPDPVILNGTAGGTNAMVQWQSTGTGVLSSPGTLNTTYTPSLADITAGSISFTFTVTDPSGTCPPASETIQWTIDGDAYYLLDNAPMSYCDTTDEIVDLLPRITFGAASGQWFFIPAQPGAIQNGNELVPGNLMPGNYTLYYAPLSSNPPCPIDTTGIPLVIRNCQCPSLALAPPPNGLCSESGTFDLATLQITPEPGTWSLVGTPAGTRPALLTGSILTINNSDPGLYTLRFTLSNSVAGCDDSADLDIAVTPTPTVTVLDTRCAPDLQSWQATLQSSTSLVDPSIGSLTDLGGGTYLVSGLPSATSLNVTVTSTDGFCSTTATIPFPDCECTLGVSGFPGNVSLCPGETITLTGQITDPKGPASGYWSIGTDTTMSATLVISQPGTYVFTAEDALGCVSSRSVSVDFYPDLFPAFQATGVTCPGDADGIIQLVNVTGGTPPFAVAIGNGAFQPVVTFPWEAGNLMAGSYTLAVMDAAGCTALFTATVDGPTGQTLSLGPDQVVLIGDSVTLLPVLSFVPQEFEWSGDLTGIDPAVLAQHFAPEQDLVVTLSATDENGCVFTDEVRIRVLLESQVNVPNIFSPNGDGVNDLVEPSFDPSVTHVDYFEIYDRWGELVYSARDYTPGAHSGWDGTFRGKRAPTGVYVYRVEATTRKDRILHRSGDITLLR